MKKIVGRLISAIPIGVAVGCMTFITALVCMKMEWTIWIAFLSWALYFLHGSTLKHGISAFAAFILGIILAQLALYYIGWMNITMGESLFFQYVIPSAVFLVALLITLIMRINDSWATYIPAVYIGTVFRFAYIDLATANPKLDNIIIDLIPPIMFGLFIGWLTVSVLTWLDKIGLAKWHKRWEIED